MTGPDASAPSAERAHFDELNALAAVAQRAIDEGPWRMGAHGYGLTPKPALLGDGHRFTLSRMCSGEPGEAAAARDADRAFAALEGAGCAASVEVFEADGTRWVRAERGGASIVVKVAVAGGRLVTAESPDYLDAAPAEAQRLLGDAAALERQPAGPLPPGA